MGHSPGPLDDDVPFDHDAVQLAADLSVTDDDDVWRLGHVEG